MADDSRARLLLIVTGSTLRAEEADRPLAYYLRQQIERRLAEIETGPPSFSVRVVADFRWLHEDAFHALPTISLGGPGVNALAQRWLDELPLCLAVDDHYFIQMQPDIEELKASIWGMDNPDTQIAVSAFLQRYLTPFLERYLALAEQEPDLGLVSDSDASDSDDEDEIDPDD